MEQEQRDVIDLDTQTSPPVKVPAKAECVRLMMGANDEFEVDGFVAVFSTWTVEKDNQF